MKKTCGKRLLAFVLAVTLCAAALPGVRALAAGDAMDQDKLKALVNAEPLYPQRTGYPELDRLLEEIDAPNRGRDAYTRLRALYRWTVDNVVYSWDGYSQDWAPAYDCFTLRYDLEYETGLPEAYPKDMIYRAYHMLTARTGVCYDWGILFAVMARYVGIESYVHTGILRIVEPENDVNWSGHHGWTELKLGGKNYIFDAQQDNRGKGLGRAGWEHFGIAPGTDWRYAQETAANQPRDASMLPVTEERIRTVNVAVRASRSGQVEGGGRCPWRQEAVLTAVGEVPLAGWYTPQGLLLSEEPVYRVVPEEDLEILALFQGDWFVDIPANAWYAEDACAAAERGLIQGMTPVTFAGGKQLTRAMMASLLARLEGADVSQAQESPFTDVSAESWYAGAVNWAYENGLVLGVSKTQFAPGDTVTREQAATMIVRWLERKEFPTAAENLRLSFSDVDEISPYARNSLSIAKGIGVLSGYGDGTIRPKAAVTRAEGTALLMRGVRYVETGGMIQSPSL